ncbi:MAG: hypothetical protein HZA88_17275 [Verrucomicrobia bacterium]|nr:hypothetical protein [Verrucomicrobiota bacterium]
MRLNHTIVVLLAMTVCEGLIAAPPESGFKPRLLQVRLDKTGVPVGGSIIVTCWWQNTGDAPCESAENVFLHVRREGEAENAAGAVRFGADYSPTIPTYRWRPGRVVTESQVIRVPDKARPGDYVLMIGMFNPLTGQRRALDLPLPPKENAHRYLVAKFRILPAGSSAEAAARTNTFAPVPPVEAGLATKSERTVMLGQGPLVLDLDAAEPRVVAWRMGTAKLWGDPEGEAPTVQILTVADNRVRPADAKPFETAWTLRQGKSSAVYRATVTEGGKPAVCFDLIFSVKSDKTEVGLSNVTETNGCQLVSLQLDRLVAATDGARLALPPNGGRLVDPLKSAPARRLLSMNWITQALAGVVHGRTMLCAADVPGVDNRLVATVGDKWAALGASFEYRAPAKASIPSLRLTGPEVIRLRFFAPQNRQPDWMDGARLLREEVKARPPKIYDHTFIYKIFCDSPGSKSFVTFEQAADMVRRIASLTDGAPQVGYLVGWQHHGHDTGYPDVFTINQRLGGLEGLKAAIKRAAQCNAILSFHDNYDDAYKDSPAWNPEFIARGPDGDLLKGGVWAGGQSYIMSFYKYGTGPGRERVRRTLAMAPIRGSYHIDVLSAVPLRRDFNPASPASGADSLRGKIAIVREFNKHGVDVTSEGFSASFVGVLGHAWHLMRKRDTLFAGEERIPFVPFVYHGRATYGGGRLNDLSDTLLYGAAQSGDFGGGMPMSEITDRYYLIEVPWLLLRRSELTDYTASACMRRVHYGSNSFIEATDDDQHYRVVIEGRPVVVDGNVFTPNWRGNAWLAYSRTGGRLDFPAPKGWTNAAKVKAVTLTPEGAGAAVPITIEGGRIRFEVPAATPVRLRYN